MEVNLTQVIGQVTVALAPAFAAGFAVQQLVQIADPGINAVLALSKVITSNWKRTATGALSLGAGVLVAWPGSLRILTTLGRISATALSSSVPSVPEWLDIAVTALIVSAGTEGFNSIMKFLSYQKEAVKADAGVKSLAATNAKTADGKSALALVNS